jgi:hypothetical protein
MRCGGWDMHDDCAVMPCLLTVCDSHVLNSIFNILYIFHNKLTCYTGVDTYALFGYREIVKEVRDSMRREKEVRNKVDL